MHSSPPTARSHLIESSSCRAASLVATPHRPCRDHWTAGRYPETTDCAIECLPIPLIIRNPHDAGAFVSISKPDRCLLAEVCVINRTPMQRRLVTVSLLISVSKSIATVRAGRYPFQSKAVSNPDTDHCQGRCRRRKRGSITAHSHVVAAALISKAKETKIRVLNSVSRSKRS